MQTSQMSRTKQRDGEGSGPPLKVRIHKLFAETSHLSARDVVEAILAELRLSSER